MKVKELIELLKTFPEELEVLIPLHSDYIVVPSSEIAEVKAVPNGGWAMRSHSSMSAANKAKEKNYLVIGLNY